MTCWVTAAVCLKSNVMFIFSITIHQWYHYILYIYIYSLQTMYVYIYLLCWQRLPLNLNSKFSKLLNFLTIQTKKIIVLWLHIFYDASVIFQGTSRNYNRVERNRDETVFQLTAIWILFDAWNLICVRCSRYANRGKSTITVFYCNRRRFEIFRLVIRARNTD